MAPAKSEATGSEGFFPIFYRKSGISEYLRCKYSDSPRPSATPLINAGGKIGTFFDSLPRARRNVCSFAYLIWTIDE